MEAKGRKMLALGVVAMMCAVAIIGIGYATFGGTAKTYNENNSAESGYIKLTNGTWTPMVDTDVEFSEYTFNNNGSDAFAYYLLPQTVVNDGTNDYYAAKLSSTSKTLNVENQTGANITAFTFNAKASAVQTDFQYILKVTVDATTKYFVLTENYTGVNFTYTLKDPSADGYQAGENQVDVTIDFYIGYQADKFIPATFIGAPANNYNETNYPYGAKVSATAPADLNAVAIGFEVLDATS